MTRTPQPMRRMRYLIGEVISQGLTPGTPGGVYPMLLEGAQRWLGGDMPTSAFSLAISLDCGHWFMTLSTGVFQPVPILKMQILTASGPECVWIGPDLTPVVIQPRTNLRRRDGSSHARQ